jgi:asparagine synthase (glutamine-hydrolysing)
MPPVCGIAGFVDLASRHTAEQMERAVTAMRDTLTHRGPDDQGCWIDPARGVAFGHRRLSVIDLSPAGHQPMVSSCGRYVIAYNGEVYSHPEMRRELEALGRTFRGHSDTEILVEAISEWGLEQTLPRLIGMFAFALWDRQACTLHLVRDRFGIKPMYWSLSPGLFLFGSELKALRAHPGLTARLDRDALAAFMRHNYVPAPHTIYRGVYKLAPGHRLAYPLGGQPQVRAWWDFREVIGAAVAGRQVSSDGAVIEEFEPLLRDAVGCRMVADVPLGALLSGGVDSSLVAALMQVQSTRPVRTFTIGFRESGYDEAPHARAVAQHLGTEHTELYVDSSHALEIVGNLTEWWDEPFADSSQIPTYIVCELTKQHVTVALSGDGGDEVFGGYNRYLLGAGIWHRASRLPAWVNRRLAAPLLRMGSETFWERVAVLIPRRLRPSQFGHKVHKLAASLSVHDPDALYLQMVSHWREPEAIVRHSREPKGPLWDPRNRALVPDLVERMQLVDTLTYLPDDILTKVDRASMAVALETRVPLLDHRVVEQAWRLPRRYKLRDGRGKWLLRQILYRHVPPSLVERPKMGFGVPLDQWLRGPLREWAERLLDGERLRRQDLFEVEPIRRRWAAHLAGENWAYPLWNVLIAQAWIERNPQVAV